MTDGNGRERHVNQNKIIVKEGQFVFISKGIILHN
jgi:hypothetical protein